MSSHEIQIIFGRLSLAKTKTHCIKISERVRAINRAVMLSKVEKGDSNGFRFSGKLHFTSVLVVAVLSNQTRYLTRKCVDGTFSIGMEPTA